MPTSRRTFLKGNINRDIDERLLPDGLYRDALNIRVSSSEGSDVGAIENCLGNERLTNLLNLTNAESIGGISDSFNNKIYWFVTSDEKDLVLEYETVNDTLTPLLESSNPNGVLNFSKDYLITGINKVYNENQDRDLLYWTDNLNPPRVINIKRFKTIAADAFIEDDISVIKRPPIKQPTYTFSFNSESSIDSLEDKFFSFASRYKYIDGGFSALSSFSSYAYSPGKLDIDLDTLENRGMRNTFNALNIEINSGSKNVTEVQLVVKESGSNSLYIVETFNKTNESIGDNIEIPYLFLNDKTYTQLPEDEINRSYDNVPNLAGTQCYANNRLFYGNYEEGFDIVDSQGNEIDINYNAEIISSSLEDTILPITLANGDQTLEIDFSNFDLSKDTRLNIYLFLSGIAPNTGATYDDFFSFILETDYPDLNALFTSQEFIDFITINMTTIFNTNYVSTPPADTASTENFGFTFTTSGNVLSLNAPYQDHTVDNTPIDNDITDGDVTIITHNWQYLLGVSEVSFNLETTSGSLKSLRNLEVGLLYEDSYNRKTSVLLSKTNTVDVPQSLSSSKNKLKITLNSLPPVDAVRYKFAIKQNKNFYENIFCTTFFTEGSFVWVKLEESTKDKVKPGDVLYVKRDSAGVLGESIKVTVLEISNKDRNFIENNYYNQATGQLVSSAGPGVTELIEPSGIYMKIKPIGFSMNYNANTFYTKSYFNDTDNGLPFITVTGERDAGIYFPITQGATVYLGIYNSVERTDRIAGFGRTYISSGNYDNFRDFFAAEVGFSSLIATYGSAAAGSAFGLTDTGTAVGIEAIHAGYGKRRTSSMYIDLKIQNSNGLVVFETIPENNISEIYYETSETFEITNGFHIGKEQNQTAAQPAEITLDFFNCFAMGEGIESIAYLDGFNKPYLNIDLRPTATTVEKFSKKTRFADITYSEPYIENTNLNGLNEFNLSRANYKDDLDKKYGSIQYMFSKDTNLLVYQEDKISTILYGKDLLLNADGTSNISSINQVLGQQIPYAGEYGISKNPESSAFFGNRFYSVDPKRGTPLRLSTDGLTEINYGLTDFFKDIFRDNTYKVYQAGYDPYFDEYLLVLGNDNDKFTIGYSERTRGWTSRYSFVPEKLIGMNNKLYSFKNGNLYIHNSENVPRNNFYGKQYYSLLQTFINENPSDDKVFKTLIYQGSEPWEATLKTNLTNGTINENEFANRESRWFAHTRGNEDQSSFNLGITQGVGVIQDIFGDSIIFSTVSELINIGDRLYFLDNSTPELIGVITEKTTTSLKVEAITTPPVNGSFAFIKKNERVEGSEIRGYYLDVILENQSTNKVELFAIESNIIKSFV